MNLGIVESANLLATFENNGVDAGVAMAGLKKAVKNYTADGMSTSEALQATIDSIKNASSETEALAIAQETFGSKGFAEMAQAIREGKISLDDLGGSLDDYSNVVQETYESTLDPWDNATVALNNLKLAGSDLAGVALQALQPAINKVTSTVKELTNRFRSLTDGQKKTVAIVLALVAAIAPVLLMFSKAVGVIKSVVDTCRILNSVMAANPITIVVLAIAALVAALVALYNKCEWFRDAVNSVFENIKEFAAGVIEEILPFITSIWDKIQEIWSNIQPYLETIWAAIQQLLVELGQFFSEAWETIKTVWSAAQPYFAEIWEAIKATFAVVSEILGQFFSEAWETIKVVWSAAQPYFAEIWEAIKATFAVVSEILGQFFSSAWETIKAVWDAAQPYFSAIWEAIKIILSVAPEILGSFFKLAWENIKIVWNVVTAYFQTIWNSIKLIFSVVKDVLTGDFRGAWEGIKNVFSGFVEFFRIAWNGAKEIFASTETFFREKFSGAWSAVKKVFSGWTSFFRGLWNSIQDTFSNLGTSISDAIGGAVKAGLNGVISTIERTINNAIGLINGAIGLINKLPGVSVGRVGYLSLPRLAHGGILGEGAAMVAEAGPELLQMVNGKAIVTPLTPTARNTAMNTAKGGATNEIKNEIQLKIENFYNNREQDIRELTEEILQVAEEIKEREQAAYA